MVEQVRKYIAKHNMLSKSDRIVAGISGGADSICLLCVLLELRGGYDLEITAVHVHHGLRGAAADADEAYVRKFCADRQVPLRVFHVDVRALARRQGWSLEEAGREARREAFAETLRECAGTRIALAHHRDDNVETVLMNLARGTGLRGLGGMLPVNPPYIRPLLGVKREEIENYLKEKNIGYCIDATNLEDAYTRNRLRNFVIPCMEREINGRFSDHVQETAEQMRDLQEYVEQQTEILYREGVIEDEGECLIPEKVYGAAPKALRPYLIHRALCRAAGRSRDIEAVHVRLVEELFQKQTGRRTSLPYGLEARRCYEGVRIGACGREENQTLLPGMEAGPEVSCRVFACEGMPETFSENPYTKWFDYDIIKSNLAIRNRMPGDCIVIGRSGGTQKIKKYFIDRKVPERMRDEIWLVAEGSQILWIVGYRQSRRYQVTERTKRILEISINGEKKSGRILPYTGWIPDVE